MPYTLTSAATLGYDLVRLPGGRQVAGVVVAALRSGPAEWSRLAAHHPLRTSDPSVDPVLAATDAATARDLAGLQPRLTGMVAPAHDGGSDDGDGGGGDGGSGDGGSGDGGPAPMAVLAEQLRSSLVGSAAALEQLLRREALDPAPEGEEEAALDRALAADVLGDAAVAAYAARNLPRALRRRLAEPYERAVAGAVVGTFELAPDLSVPWGPALRSLLAALRDLDALGRARWRRAVDAGRADRLPWARTMHDSCWAAHTSGRVPAAAAAQMLAVQAFLDAGFDVDDGATGVWNAVSGCVQGLLVADLLTGEALDVLTAPWALATGEALLAG